MFAISLTGKDLTVKKVEKVSDSTLKPELRGCKPINQCSTIKCDQVTKNNFIDTFISVRQVYN